VQENTQSKLRLRVKDNGHGMTEEQLPHIFDRFHKLSDSGHPGTGIGLAFVKEIVDLLKGQIQVKSARAQGTEVDVFLPITTTHPSMDISSSSRPVKTLPITSEVELTPSEDLPLLLLIEDNREVSAYIRKLLHKRYDIHLAFDGKQGHDQALALVPDIIICDVMMPKMNGFQVTRQLKENQKTSHIPIILLTAKATQADKNEGLQSGADTFLMKPFNKQELFIRLANMDRQRKVLIEKFRLGLLDAGDTPDSKGHPTREHAFLQTVQQSLLDHIEDSDFGVEDIANGMNLSKNQFYRKMKALTGQSPTVYVRDIRLNEARDLLERTTMNVSEIAFRVGFNDPNYFTRLFHRKFGKAPSQYAVKR
nr:response regulator [Saprospiraceae bacterium]